MSTLPKRGGAVEWLIGQSQEPKNENRFVLGFVAPSVLQFFSSSVLQFFGSSVLWFFGSSVLWFFGSSVLWFFGSLVLRFFGSSLLRFFASSVLLSGEALDRVDDGFENFEVLVESRNLQNLAVGVVAGGDLQVTLQRPQRFLGVDQGFQTARLDRLAAV